MLLQPNHALAEGPTLIEPIKLDTGPDSLNRYGGMQKREHRLPRTCESPPHDHLHFKQIRLRGAQSDPICAPQPVMAEEPPAAPAARRAFSLAFSIHPA